MLENNKRAITNEQSREIGNIGYIRRRQTKDNMCQLNIYIRKQPQIT